MMNGRPTVGVILGRGFEHVLSALGGIPVELETPYGAPSGPVLLTELGSLRLAVLRRHGVDGLLPAARVNFRANIWALKKLGATQVVATSTVRSLRAELPPGELVLVEQLLDPRSGVGASFFEEVPVQVDMGLPFCERMREEVAAGAIEARQRVGSRGTYVCVDGSRHATAAEAEWWRALGGHLVGSSAMPEAALAREAELCYALIAAPRALEGSHALPAHALGERLRQDARMAAELRNRMLELLACALPRLGGGAELGCSCQSSLATAIGCDLRLLGEPLRKRYELLLGRYYPAPPQEPMASRLEPEAVLAHPERPKKQKKEATGLTRVTVSPPEANHLTSSAFDAAFGEAFSEGL